MENDNRKSRQRTAAGVMVLFMSMMMVGGCVSSGGYASRERMEVQQLAEDIQAMIDQTPDGGIVHLKAGRYIINKGLNISRRKELSIVGVPGTQILLTDTDQDVITIENSESIRIFSILAKHILPLSQYDCHGNVISILNSSSITIANSELNGSGAVGVHAFQSGPITIEHCYIHSNTFNALYFHQVSNVRLWSNVIVRNANTLQAYNMNDVEMSGNVIRDNSGYWRTPAHRPGLLEWSGDERTTAGGTSSK